MNVAHAGEAQRVAVGRILLEVPALFDAAPIAVNGPLINDYKVEYLAGRTLRDVVAQARADMPPKPTELNLDGSEPVYENLRLRDGAAYVIAYDAHMAFYTTLSAGVLVITGTPYDQIADRIAEMEALAKDAEPRGTPTVEEGFQFPGGIILGPPRGREWVEMVYRSGPEDSDPLLAVVYRTDAYDKFILPGTSRLGPLLKEAEVMAGKAAGQSSLMMKAPGDAERGTFRTVIPVEEGATPYFTVQMKAQPGGSGDIDQDAMAKMWTRMVTSLTAAPGTFR